MKLAVLAALVWSALFLILVHGPHGVRDWAIAILGGVVVGLIVLELHDAHREPRL